MPDARHEEVEHSQFTRGKRGAETTSNAADGAFSTRPNRQFGRGLGTVLNGAGLTYASS